MDISPQSALRKSQTGAGSVESPTVTEKGTTEYASLQQLREWKAEAEERMNSLNNEIARVSERLSEVEVSVDPRQTSLKNMRKRASTASVASVVTFKLPGDATPDHSDDEVLGEASGLPYRLPLARRDKHMQRSNSAESDDNSCSAGTGLTEVWDPCNSTQTENMEYVRKFHDREGELKHLLAGTKDLSRERSTRRCTIYAQGLIASKMSWGLRLFGLALAFLTMVFLWELLDLVMSLMFPDKEKLLISYMVLAVLAAACLALSHEWVHWCTMNTGESSLPASFAYALSTLYLAIGTWGVIKATVEVLAPKTKLFVYAAGGLISFIATVFYSFETRHNVLLDIASCATTMGLHDDEKGSFNDYYDIA